MIGKMILDDVDMSDPEDREMVEKFRRSVEALEKADREWKAPDLSNVPTEEIIDMMIYLDIYADKQYRNAFNELTSEEGGSKKIFLCSGK